MTFRGFLMWVHLVLGLTGSVIIAIVAVTGAYITFQQPLARWLNPIPVVESQSASLDALAIVRGVEERFAPRRVASIAIGEGNQATTVRLRDRSTVFVDPSNSSIIGVREARFASLENLTLVMRRLHTSLVLGRKGTLLVVLATAQSLLLALTGIWLWWRKKHWQFRAWRGPWFRISWDLHSASGIWFLIPVLSMVVTGLLIAMPSPVYRVVGVAPTPWRNAPPSANTDSQEQVPLARAIAVADSVLPGGVIGVTIPGSHEGSFAVNRSTETVFVDQFTGALIEVRTKGAPNEADDAYTMVEELHTGELFGVPGRTIMTLGTLMLAVMTVTGVVLGWKRLLILGGKLARD